MQQGRLPTSPLDLIGKRRFKMAAASPLYELLRGLSDSPSANTTRGLVVEAS